MKSEVKFNTSKLGVSIEKFCTEYQKCFLSQKPIRGEVSNRKLDKKKMYNLLRKYEVLHEVPHGFGSLKSAQSATPFDIFWINFEHGKLMFF